MKRVFAVALLAICFLAACSGQNAATPSPEATAAPTAAPTAVPTPTPIPETDYGRAREGEFVYRDADGAHYHEGDCPNLFGTLEGVRFEDAKDEGLLPADDCVALGRSATADFPYNQGFERTMQIARKIMLVSEAGEVQKPMIYVTTGDLSFDLNNVDINFSSRFFYKELQIDPAVIEVFVVDGRNDYHAPLCSRVATNDTRVPISLPEAYEREMRTCSECNPPVAAYNTLPILAEDDAHFFYVSQSFIRRVENLKDHELVDPSMNLDMKWIANGYLDGEPKPAR